MEIETEAEAASDRPRWTAAGGNRGELARWRTASLMATNPRLCWISVCEWAAYGERYEGAHEELPALQAATPDPRSGAPCRAVSLGKDGSCYCNKWVLGRINHGRRSAGVTADGSSKTAVTE